MDFCHPRQCLKVAIICAIFGGVFSVSAEPAPEPSLDPALIEKIVARRLTRQDTLLNAIIVSMEDAKYIVRGVGKSQNSQQFSSQKARGSGHTQHVKGTQDMLLSAKITELSTLQGEVRQRFARYRNRLNELGLNDKAREWDRRAQQIDRRFSEISDMLLAIRSADKSQDRAHTARLALNKLDKLLFVPGNKPEVLPEMKPTLRPEKTQPYRDLSVAESLPRYVQDQ